jgi:hypothetical protein
VGGGAGGSGACCVCVKRVPFRQTEDLEVEQIRMDIQHLFPTNQTSKKNQQKRLIYSVAILKRAVFAYYMPIRLEGLLILQRVRRPIGREKVLCSRTYCFLDVMVIGWRVRETLEEKRLGEWLRVKVAGSGTSIYSRSGALV